MLEIQGKMSSADDDAESNISIVDSADTSDHEVNVEDSANPAVSKRTSLKPDNSDIDSDSSDLNEEDKLAIEEYELSQSLAAATMMGGCKDDYECGFDGYSGGYNGGEAAADDIAAHFPKDYSYEFIEKLHDPLVFSTKEILGIVKQFIIDRKLVIVGGMAIDYCLRQKGEKIYDERDVSSILPDWDFYSPNHIRDAYELANLLYVLGYSRDNSGETVYKIDANRALHASTIRVRFYYEVVADVTFIHPTIFARLPTIEIGGLRVIHPNWQTLNIHLSLSYPIKNPPLEAIFHRLQKDVSRGYRLMTLFPVKQEYTPIDHKITPFPEFYKQGGKGVGELYLDHPNRRTLVAYGFLAYNCIVQYFNQIFPDSSSGILAEKLTPAGFTSLNNTVEFIASKSIYNKFVETHATGATRYNGFIDFILPYTSIKQSLIEVDGGGKSVDVTINMYELAHDIVPYSKLIINGETFLLPSVHHILLYFLYKYNLADTDAIKNTYGYYYNSLLTICQTIYAFVDKNKFHLDKYELGDKTAPAIVKRLDNIIFNSPFFIPKHLYGEDNSSESDVVRNNELKSFYNTLVGSNEKVGEFVDLPRMNYSPDNFVTQYPELENATDPATLNSHHEFLNLIQFDYDRSKYFNQIGNVYVPPPPLPLIPLVASPAVSSATPLAAGPAKSIAPVLVVSDIEVERPAATMEASSAPATELEKISADIENMEDMIEITDTRVAADDNLVQ